MKVRSIHVVPSKSAHSGTVTQWGLFKKDEFLSTINGINANIISPGTSLEPHQHENVEHLYFILGGVGIAIVGDEEQEVREGDTIYMPPRLDHAMRNTGTYPMRFLTISAEIE
ncbi:cupin domain-containing protein [Chloroflexota bacterium]